MSSATHYELTQTDSGLWNVYYNGKIIRAEVTLEQWEAARTAQPIDTELESVVAERNELRFKLQDAYAALGKAEQQRDELQRKLASQKAAQS